MNLQQSQHMHQKLVMTNKMKQSLALLQMPVNELLEAVKNELDENPVLEEVTGERQSDDSNETNETSADFEVYDKNDAAFYEEKTDPLFYAAKTKTLKDYLYEQAGYLKEPPEIKNVISYMIECVDERGYLGCGIADIANEMSVSSKVARRCLSIAQEFQPDGVFARDLSECLIIQLRKKNVTQPHAYEIAESYLGLLSENKIKTIARKLNISVSEALLCRDIIKGLEPKPSRGFADCDDNADNPFITPEAYIKKLGETLAVILNDECLPKLKVLDNREELCGALMNAESKRYISERLNSAHFFIKCIEQRRKTMHAILTAIVSEQEDFFLNGRLKPMTIQKVAAHVGCHESTVSRAIQNKYVETPQGLIKIKSLFTTGFGESDSQTSSSVVKNSILTLVQNEDKRSPLSDSRIADALAECGMCVSRRAIAKYRMEMAIPSSSKRKILF